MVEYASVRSSLYDIDSLVSQLNERAGDGWEVVQILPTGGDVTAVLRRSPEPDEPVVEAGSDGAADVAAVVAVDEDAAAIDASPDLTEVTVVEEIEAEPVTEDVVVEEIVAVTEPVVPEPVVEEPVVEEPAGWAAAPVVADTVSEVEPAADETPAGAADAAASATDTSTYAPVVEETPPPAPEPIPEPVAAEPAPAAAAPAPPSPPPAPAAPSIPAGWYPDPSGRFELRYWDGNAWSEHTARQGQMFTDPPVA